MGGVYSCGAEMHLYGAYGLTVAVPFRCDGLTAATGATADVLVSLGPVGRALDAPVVSDERWDAEPRRFLLRGGRRAGRFLVADGQVVLECNPAAEEEVLARCFTHEVLPAVLRQRGLLVLHANAALTSRGAVLIAGPSGAGKSTTLAALMDRGCAMLADDLTALAPAPGGHVDVLPGAARVHLTAHAVSGLGYEAATPKPPPSPGGPGHDVRPGNDVTPGNDVRPGHDARPGHDPGPGVAPTARRGKSAVATAERMAPAPARLAAIYVLGTDAGRKVRLRPMRGLRKFDALQECIYGPVLADEHPGVFGLGQAVMRTAEVYRLERPAERWTVPEVADIVLGAEGVGAGGTTRAETE